MDRFKQPKKKYRDATKELFQAINKRHFSSINFLGLSIQIPLDVMLSLQVAP